MEMCSAPFSVCGTTASDAGILLRPDQLPAWGCPSHNSSCIWCILWPYSGALCYHIIRTKSFPASLEDQARPATGKLPEQIVRVAETDRCDLIVMRNCIPTCR